MGIAGESPILAEPGIKPPTPAEQITFLRNIQRLLAEGRFVATYKYALLIALADISVELGDDSGGALLVPTSIIAEKFIQYYWRQVVPFVGVAGQRSDVLQQNTGTQAAIINMVAEARTTVGGSYAKARHDPQHLHLVKSVEG
ncbi:MAG TPA: hypothetical protein VGG64_28285, partial [Pirellulales bacterium]